jgi:acetyl/propionyl-CoA carboxylase alpha subunit
MEYDSMLAKLAVWGETRAVAAARLERALGEYAISGIRTNTSFFREVLRDADYLAGRIHTGFLDEFALRRSPAKPDGLAEIVAAVAALHAARRNGKANPAAGVAEPAWKRARREELLR